jgi:cysteinyl-tRNA synthetase
MKEAANMLSAVKNIVVNMWLHFHFLTTETQKVAIKIKATNIESISIPQSHILINLQGRSLKR